MVSDKGLIAASPTPRVPAILVEGGSYIYMILHRVREVADGRMAWMEGRSYPGPHRLERSSHIGARRAGTANGGRHKDYSSGSTGHR
jgi:hypothetical protein